VLCGGRCVLGLASQLPTHPRHLYVHWGASSQPASRRWVGSWGADERDGGVTGAGVAPLQQHLATLTRVPVDSQTLVGPGGRKWAVGSDLVSLGVKAGSKVTLIGKVPPGWTALEAAAKAFDSLLASAEVLLGSGRAGGAAAMQEVGGARAASMEQLTKHLLRLDSIDAGGDDALRAARKAEVQRTQALLERLEAAAAAQ
jgi:hypothetical protein